jgi:hypothetical protein
MEHPTEKGRTMITDIEKKIDGYINRLDRQGNDFFNTGAIGRIKAEVREEYFPTPKKEKEDEDGDGDGDEGDHAQDSKHD